MPAIKFNKEFGLWTGRNQWTQLRHPLLRKLEHTFLSINYEIGPQTDQNGQIQLRQAQALSGLPLEQLRSNSLAGR
jgi:hypothetical protein